MTGVQTCALPIYNEAEKIFQSVLDKVNLSIDFDDPKSDILKSIIHNIYYKLGLINLKMHNYYLARQNFISGSTSLKENKALIDRYVSYNWATNAVFKLCVYIQQLMMHFKHYGLSFCSAQHVTSQSVEFWCDATLRP